MNTYPLDFSPFGSSSSSSGLVHLPCRHFGSLSYIIHLLGGTSLSLTYEWVFMSYSLTRSSAAAADRDDASPGAINCDKSWAGGDLVNNLGAAGGYHIKE